MGINDSLVVDEKVERSGAEARGDSAVRSSNWSLYLALFLIAASVYLSGIISPPHFR